MLGVQTKLVPFGYHQSGRGDTLFWEENWFIRLFSFSLGGKLEKIRRVVDERWELRVGISVTGGD
jgi:hypothetical protein